MKYQIWTRIVVTSLILLGDSALASEINHRSDAVASGNAVQVYQPELLDDSDSKWQPTFTEANSTQTKANLRYQTLAPIVYSTTYTTKYNLYNPRAPPVL